MPLRFEDSEIETRVGDVVQITDEGHHWYPSLIIVDEVKPWGVVGYCLIPKDNQGDVVSAFIRLESKTFTRIGIAAVVRWSVNEKDTG